MSEHCQHCEGCREGFGYAGNGLVYSREALIYDGWAHHCFIDGAGYLHWDDGKCPLCAAAQRERAKERWWRAWDNGHACGVECGSNEERAAIVAWLRNCDGFTRFTVAGAEGSSIAMWDKNDYADAVEHGGHLRGDDE